MLKALLSLLHVALLAAFLICPSSADAERVRLALPSRSMGYLPMFVALHRGFLKDENIELELPAMLPNIAHNALLSGEVDYHGVADSALRLAAKGAPLKAIFFSARLPNYFLMSKPTIRSVSELRGKMVAVSRFGGTTDLAARVALQSNGLDPQKDVVLIMIGLGNTRNAALMAGSVDANIANPPDNSMLKQKGFRELLFLGDAIEFPSNGFTTTEKRLAENRDQVKRMMRAFYRGLLFTRENPEETIKLVEREWKLDPTMARDSYQSIMKAATRDGSSSDAGLKVHVKLMQASDKSIGDVPLNRMVDFRVLEEVRKEVAR
ncbi:MAG: ABC transporter substrate-binding protein [Deltaproteobacteria bacterium]|nr:ABC transporter substrate-binding protein [Deltaproteobacteria bacterium]